MKLKFIIPLLSSVIAIAMAVPSIPSRFKHQIVPQNDTTIAVDPLLHRMKKGNEAVAPQVDTTKMDSLQLAIFRHS